MNISGAMPFFSEESLNNILEEIKSVLKSGRLTDGPKAEEFETKFAEYNPDKIRRFGQPSFRARKILLIK